MKTVSGDDFLVVMYDADHECYYSAATDLNRFEKHAALLRPDDADQSLQSSANDASDDPPFTSRTADNFKWGHRFNSIE